MRLWHYKLIPYLPKSQLLGQWRELNSIFRLQNKHILINYVYDYSKEDLLTYSYVVLQTMYKRGYKFNLDNFYEYFRKYNEYINLDAMLMIKHMKLGNHVKLFESHHNDEYLTICYWNLREKYIRGQKDFTKDIWEKIETFYKEECDSYERNKKN